LPDFFAILGGSAALGLPGMWFSWCDPFDIVTAWRKVGIAGNRLDPSLISRNKFIDRDLSETVEAAPAAAPLTFDECVRTPEDMRGATRLAKAERKLELAREFAQQQAEEHRAEKRRRIFDPEAYGLLPVPQQQVQPPEVDHARLDCLNGSMSLREMHRVNTERLENARVAEAERQRKADGREQARMGRASEAADLIASFERCSPQCTCAASPCPMAKATRCAACLRISIKGRACGRAGCKATLAALPVIEQPQAEVAAALAAAMQA